MEEKLFENWLIENNRPTRYSKTLNTISKDLEKVEYKDYNLYAMNDSTFVEKIKIDYFNIDEYYQKNKRGQNMYNSALNRYIEFLEDEKNLVTDIEEIVGIKLFTNTESMNLVKCRLGQGTFREALIDYWKGCSVTSFKNLGLLIASHIKPWNVSSNEERIDLYNGLLLIPNLDKLFDKGYISFDNNGKILISSLLNDYESLGINLEMKIEIIDKHKVYLEYHRNNIFKT